MRRLSFILALVGVLATFEGSSSAAPQTPPPQAVAKADAYVTASAKTKNFGGSRVLRVGRNVRAYLRFDLSGFVDTTVTKATLRLYVRSPAHGAAIRFSVRSTNSGWSERGITYRNAPRAGARIASAGRRGNGLVTVDVTRAVRGVKSLDLVLTASRALQFASREAGPKAPRIDFVLEPPATLIAAGDIGDCASTWDEATAAMVKNMSGTVAALGDLAYNAGTAAEFNACYQPSWGQFKDRTKPAPGNHDYGNATGDASGYFGYWGAVAGTPGQGWYSYELGKWHIVSLNSNCDFVGCYAGSPQEAWLRADLAAHKTGCTLAYWHHPLFSGGTGQTDPMTQPLFQALYDANADVVLVGHAHNYQRFAPQNSAGVADGARGIREFVVGTGGHRMLHSVVPVAANTEVANSATWGVIELTLRPKSYDWHFVPVAGQSFTDSGSQACH